MHIAVWQLAFQTRKLLGIYEKQFSGLQAQPVRKWNATVLPNWELSSQTDCLLERWPIWSLSSVEPARFICELAEPASQFCRTNGKRSKFWIWIPRTAYLMLQALEIQSGVVGGHRSATPLTLVNDHCSHFGQPCALWQFHFSPRALAIVLELACWFSHNRSH